MINLLPEQDKKSIRREYSVRLAVLSMWALFVLLVAGGALLGLAFLNTHLEKAAARVEKDRLDSGKASILDRDLQAGISDINSKLAIFKFNHEWSPSRAALLPVLERRGAGIKIVSFFWEFSSERNAFKLRGTAANREQLLSFWRLLETLPEFARVDLPISDFVKGQDLKFQLDINMSEKK